MFIVYLSPVTLPGAPAPDHLCEEGIGGVVLGDDRVVGLVVGLGLVALMLSQGLKRQEQQEHRRQHWGDTYPTHV